MTATSARAAGARQLWPDACPRCGTTRREVHYSERLGAWLCLRCYLAQPCPADLCVSDEEAARWEAERAERYGDDEPRRPVFDRPADRLLHALRATGRDAYRCDAERPNVWHAYCPACGSRAIGQRTLTLTELRPGGAATIRCRTGCTQAAIRAALADAEAAFDADPPWWAAT